MNAANDQLQLATRRAQILALAGAALDGRTRRRRVWRAGGAAVACAALAAGAMLMWRVPMETPAPTPALDFQAVQSAEPVPFQRVQRGAPLDFAVVRAPQPLAVEALPDDGLVGALREAGCCVTVFQVRGHFRVVDCSSGAPFRRPTDAPVLSN